MSKTYLKRGKCELCDCEIVVATEDEFYCNNWDCFKKNSFDKQPESYEIELDYSLSQVEKAHIFLKQIARDAELTTYGQIANIAELNLQNPDDHYNKLCKFLQAINDLDGNKEFLITSLVTLAPRIGKERWIGEGFFDLAKDMKLLRRDATHDGKRLFWREQVKKSHEFYNYGSNNC